MKNLIHEIHRRSLWQVLGIYLAVSWIVLQVVDVIGNNFGLPDWVAPAALILLLLGLPIVIGTAFIQEGMTTREPEAPKQSLADLGEVDPPKPSGHRRLFTWRNALVGGGAAFALLAVLTGGYLFMRTAGIGPAGTLVAQGVLEEREPVIVADFHSVSGDVELASAATEALRIDLSQSSVIALVDRATVKEILGRMGRPADTRLTSDLALEVAQRGEINAVIDGQIDAAGRGYVLSARLVSTADGEILVSRRETASDSSEIIGAIDDLSRGLRERIGESLGSIARTPALEQVSTPSLRALRLYSQAEDVVLNQGDNEHALVLLEAALEEDSAFAMAWRKLGTIRSNEGLGLAGVYEAWERAYALRGRLPDRDRYLSEAQYFAGRGDPQRAIMAYETLLASQPDEGFALTNLGIQLELMGDRERALELYERSYASDSIALSLMHVVRGLQNTGRFEQAEARLAELQDRFPDYAFGRMVGVLLAIARGEEEEASRELDSLVAEHAGSLQWRLQAELVRGGKAARRGRLAEAARHFARARDLELERGLPARYIRGACDLAFLRLLVAEDPSTALEPVEAALSEVPLATLDPLDRPYLELASVYALAGRTERAARILEEYDDVVPEDRRGSWSSSDHRFARGEVALAAGRAEEAARQFGAVEGNCHACALPRLAEAQARMGATDAAIESLEAFVSDPDILRLGTRINPWWSYGDWVSLGPSYESLGQLYDERGDLESAAKYYAMFVDLWSEPDEELRPRVRAAQSRIEAILGEIG